MNVEQQAAQNRPQYGSEPQSSQNMPYNESTKGFARHEDERHHGASAGQTGVHDRHARGDDDRDRRGHGGRDNDHDRGRSGGD